MESKGLVFIPDISGFTEFVNQVEIDHGRLIIKELLEILIDANETGLEISEIEGDAILFYRFGQEPSLQEIYRQVEKMFCSFHQSLKEYEHRRYCQCKACLSAVQLTLKVITHYGEFTTYDVRNFKKLIGRDIIVAHRLLKNDIDSHEYWLVTDSLYSKPGNGPLPSWVQWADSRKETEAGEISFHYVQLSPLKKQLASVPLYRPSLSEKDKELSLSAEYPVDILTLFHASGDPAQRHRWVPGVKKIEVTNHFLPRVGMRWKVLLDNGETASHASSYFYQEHRIEFSETDESTGYITHYILEKINDAQTRLTIEIYVPKSSLGKILFRLGSKKNYRQKISGTLKALYPFAQQLAMEEGNAAAVSDR
jgi:hypothetical protein